MKAKRGKKTNSLLYLRFFLACFEVKKYLRKALAKSKSFGWCCTNIFDT